MADDLRDVIRDELSGWPIGSGYYQTTVGTDEARDMADALLPLVREREAEAEERGYVDGYERHGGKPRNPLITVREIVREREAEVREALDVLTGADTWEFPPGSDVLEPMYRLVQTLRAEAARIARGGGTE
ncbi:MAG: hypothetical protein ACTHJM_12120 [Marmoricola sp.]